MSKITGNECKRINSDIYRKRKENFYRFNNIPFQRELACIQQITVNKLNQTFIHHYLLTKL